MNEIAEKGTHVVLSETPEDCKIIFPSTHVVFEGKEDLINDIDEKLLNNRFRIIEECGKTTGHEFITERELGMYGETFTWCKHCDYGN